MVEKLRLLVHAGAPSSRKDDDRYRAQAEAYLQFKGQTSRLSEHLQPSNRADDSAGNAMIKTATIIGPLMAAGSPLRDSTIFLEDTQSAFIALESQLETSSLLLPCMTPARKRLASLISEEAVSPVNRLVSQQQLDRSPKRQRVISSDSRAQSSLQPISKPFRQIDGSGLKSGDPPLTANQVGDVARHTTPASGAQEDVTSELPSSYSLSNVTSETPRRRPQGSQRSVSDPGQLLIRKPPDDSGPRSHSQPKDGQSCTETIQPVTLDKRDLLPSAAIHGMKGTAGAELILQSKVTAAKPPAVVDPELVLILSNLPWYIHPPDSPVSTESFKTHVTEKLRFLAEKSEISNHYQPLSTSREPRIWERGYWTFNPDGWPLKLQIDFWQSFERMIGEETIAGWGVWCSREASGIASLGMVKVFCWGEVVRHVYLLLFVASRSKVRKLGLQWIDSDGEVVVQMRKPDGLK